MHDILLFCGYYWIAVSLIAAVITVWDKVAAKRHCRRIPEATLMLIAAVGGAIVMWLTMKLIRHKTRKPKFMIGIPLLIVLHLAAIIGLWLWQNGFITLPI